MKNIVPIEFYNGDEQPTAYTVGELIEELKRLPRNLRIESGFDKGCCLTVFNIGSDPFLEIRDIE